VHKFNNIKSSYHFLKNFVTRCAHSIAFYPSLRNYQNMQLQCALRPTPTPFIFFGGHYPWLTVFKIHWKHAQIAQNCVYNVQKLFAGGGGGWQKKGKRGGERRESPGCLRTLLNNTKIVYFVTTQRTKRCVKSHKIAYETPQNRLRLELHPRSRWGSLRCSPIPSSSHLGRGTPLPISPLDAFDRCHWTFVGTGSKDGHSPIFEMWLCPWFPPRLRHQQ